ncbi:MAG: phosphoribosyltransferase family protein [Candidatus Bathyarchaeota archaeon]|nr:phosphoribosyltransferase family protein [Candidatus Bathyarchaeota archaeon]
MNGASTHAEELKLRLMTIELLRAAKKHYTYRELSSKTDLPVTVLSRYAKGHVLPNAERARSLWKILKKLVGLETELGRKIRFNKEGYFDNTWIIGDFNILRQASSHALTTFAGRRVTKILTAAVDGIPLATMVADALGVDLVIAKRNKEVGVPVFLEETYVLSNSGVTMTLYVPKNAFRRRDSVLIVDDMIKTGETQAALINLIRKARAEVSGIYSLIAIGNDWEKKINLPKGCPIEVVTKVRAQ